MKRLITAAFVIAALVGALACSSVTAQVVSNFSASDGITVSGNGDASARPNLVEIDMQVTGKAELTGDALVKYRDAKKRLLEALEKVKVPNLAVSDHGLSINVGNSAEVQQRIMNGQMQNPGKPQVEVVSTVRMRISDVREIPPEELIKTVGRLMDVAQDAGVTIGPSAADQMRAYRYGQAAQNSLPVRFVLTDLGELREKAYEAAVADARSRATRLAKLHQVKVGAPTSIQEIVVGGDQPVSQAIQINLNQFNSQNSTPTASESEGPRIVSSSLAGIPVQVKLMVRFAIAPPDPSTAQK